MQSDCPNQVPEQISTHLRHTNFQEDSRNEPSCYSLTSTPRRPVEQALVNLCEHDMLKEINRQEELIREQASLIKNLRDHLDRKLSQNVISETNQKIYSQESRIHNRNVELLQQDLDKSKKRKRRLCDEIVFEQGRCVALTRDLDKKQEKIDELVEQVNLFKNDIDAHKIREIELIRRESQLKSDLTALDMDSRSTVTILEAKLNKVNETSSDMHTELMELKKEHGKVLEEVQLVMEESQVAKTELNVLKNIFGTFEKRRSEFEKNKEYAEKEWRMAQLKVKELQETLDSHREELDSLPLLIFENASIKLRVKTAESKNSLMMRSLTELDLQCEQLMKLKTHANDMRKKAMDEIVHLTTDLKAKEREVEEMKRTVAEMDVLRAKNDRLETKIIYLNKELHVYTQELHVYKARKINEHKVRSLEITVEKIEEVGSNLPSKEVVTKSPRILPTQPSRRIAVVRNPFSFEEDQDLLIFVYKELKSNNPYAKTPKGKKLWQIYREQNPSTRRTISSLTSRFRKHIYQNMSTFNIEPCVLLYLLQELKIVLGTKETRILQEMDAYSLRFNIDGTIKSFVKDNRHPHPNLEMVYDSQVHGDNESSETEEEDDSERITLSRRSDSNDIFCSPPPKRTACPNVIPDNRTLDDDETCPHTSRRCHSPK